MPMQELTMAGEKKGKAYEALVYVALEQLVAAGKLAGPVHWNVTPKGMSIEPDFVTGKDPDNPKTVLLLSHCGSAKNSDMKAWRNLGELVEAKTVLPSVPRVYCILLGIMKADWEPIQQHAFDHFVWIRQATHPWAGDLDTFIVRCVSDFPKGKDSQADFISAELKGGSAKAKSAFQKLKSLLESMHKAKSVALDKLWADHRKRAPPSAPSVRNTYLRRGTTKFFIVSSLTHIQTDGTFSKGYDKLDGKALVALGLASPVPGGHRITDTEMIWCLRNLGVDRIERLHEIRSNELVMEWVDTLRGLTGVVDQVNYIIKHWNELCSPKGMFVHLSACHRNPHKLCPSAVPADSKRVWLFHAIIELIKAGSNSRTGYGLAVLVDDLSRLARDADHVKSVENLLGRKARWLAKHTLGLGLTDWHSNPSKQRFAFAEDDLARTSDALSRRVAKLAKPHPVLTPPILSQHLVQTVFEAKLMTYRNYKPFEMLLKESLASLSTKRIASCFADSAVSDGVPLDPRSSCTEIALMRSTIINWQSCSDAGRDHKKKELCGRAIGLRYHWNGKAFVRRPGIQKMILVLDGTWRQADLNALLRAGWDEIFYPDEMDQLAKAIV